MFCKNVLSLGSVIIVTQLVVSCGGGGSGGDGSVALVGDGPGVGVAEEAPVSFVPPRNAVELGTLLTTRFESDDNYDYWRCDGLSGPGFNILAAADVFVEDQQVGFALEEPGGDAVVTIWGAVGPDALFIEIVTTGEAFDFTGLVFEDADTFRIPNSADGALDCSRESYIDGSITEPNTIEDAPQNVPPTEDDLAPSGGSLPAVVSPPGIVAMRGIQVFRILPSGIFGLDDDAILTFNDGTFTFDLAGVMRDGIGASRAANPEDWGQWRLLNDGTLELLEEGDSEYDDVVSWILTPGNSDQRLNECYTAIGGAGSLFDGGISNVNFSTVCFLPNGQFTHDSALFAGGPFVDTSTVSPQSAGVYRIDGNAIRFVYNSGRDETFAFGINVVEGGVPTSVYLNDDLHTD